MFSLELGKDVCSKTCSCCGKQYKSVVGFIKRNNDFYAVYFAALQTGHEEAVAGLTISIGKWWDSTALDERHWIHLTVRSYPRGFGMTVEEPSCSSYLNFKPLGIALSRNEALSSYLKDDFFAVADYVVEKDPAVNSYLTAQVINIRGRACRH